MLARSIFGKFKLGSLAWEGMGFLGYLSLGLLLAVVVSTFSRKATGLLSYIEKEKSKGFSLK